ncbi:MAG: sugar nucleotide-binding protein, partial [Candidatus Omnitrophica bacterium]|nr:sugar nucleotide-binding protein [Candidatus Omnitrophota bacterium]
MLKAERRSLEDRAIMALVEDAGFEVTDETRRALASQGIFFDSNAALLRYISLLRKENPEFDRGYTASVVSRQEREDRIVMREYESAGCKTDEELLQGLHASGAVPQLNTVRTLNRHITGLRKKYREFDNICSRADEARPSRKKRDERIMAVVEANQFNVTEDVREQLAMEGIEYKELRILKHKVGILKSRDPEFHRKWAAVLNENLSAMAHRSAQPVQEQEQAQPAKEPPAQGPVTKDAPPQELNDAVLNERDRNPALQDWKKAAEGLKRDKGYVTAWDLSCAMRSDMDTAVAMQARLFKAYPDLKTLRAPKQRTQIVPDDARREDMPPVPLSRPHVSQTAIGLMREAAIAVMRAQGGIPSHLLFSTLIARELGQGVSAADIKSKLHEIMDHPAFRNAARSLFNDKQQQSDGGTNVSDSGSGVHREPYYLRARQVPGLMNSLLDVMLHEGVRPDIMVFIAEESLPLIGVFMQLWVRKGLELPPILAPAIHADASNHENLANIREQTRKHRVALNGKRILVVDATCYTGRTLRAARKLFTGLGAQNIRTCSMVTRAGLRGDMPDYAGILVRAPDVSTEWYKELHSDRAFREFDQAMAEEVELFLSSVRKDGGSARSIAEINRRIAGTDPLFWTPVEKIELGIEEIHADLLLDTADSRLIFILGSTGSGKSVIAQSLIEQDPTEGMSRNDARPGRYLLACADCAWLTAIDGQLYAMGRIMDLFNTGWNFIVRDEQGHEDWKHVPAVSMSGFREVKEIIYIRVCKDCDTVRVRRIKAASRQPGIAAYKEDVRKSSARQLMILSDRMLNAVFGRRFILVERPEARINGTYVYHNGQLKFVTRGASVQTDGRADGGSLSRANGNTIKVLPNLARHGRLYFIADACHIRHNRHLLIYNADAHHDTWAPRNELEAVRYGPGGCVDIDACWGWWLQHRRRADIVFMPSYLSPDGTGKLEHNWNTPAARAAIIKKARQAKARKWEQWLTVDFDSYSLKARFDLQTKPIYHMGPEEVRGELTAMAGFFEEHGILPSVIVPCESRDYLAVTSRMANRYCAMVRQTIIEVFEEVADVDNVWQEGYGIFADGGRRARSRQDAQPVKTDTVSYFSVLPEDESRARLQLKSLKIRAGPDTLLAASVLIHHSFPVTRETLSPFKAVIAGNKRFLNKKELSRFYQKNPLLLVHPRLKEKIAFLDKEGWRYVYLLKPYVLLLPSKVFLLPPTAGNLALMDMQGLSHLYFKIPCILGSAHLAGNLEFLDRTGLSYLYQEIPGLLMFPCLADNIKALEFRRLRRLYHDYPYLLICPNVAQNLEYFDRRGLWPRYLSNPEILCLHPREDMSLRGRARRADGGREDMEKELAFVESSLVFIDYIEKYVKENCPHRSLLIVEAGVGRFPWISGKLKELLDCTVVVFDNNPAWVKESERLNEEEGLGLMVWPGDIRDYYIQELMAMADLVFCFRPVPELDVPKALGEFGKEYDVNIIVYIAEPYGPSDPGPLQKKTFKGKCFYTHRAPRKADGGQAADPVHSQPRFNDDVKKKFARSQRTNSYWMASQVVLTAVIVLLSRYFSLEMFFPFGSLYVRIAGAAIGLTGGAIALPHYRYVIKRVEDGLTTDRLFYRWIRHPIYLGFIIVFSSFALVISPVAAIFLPVFVYLTNWLAQKEEDFLIAAFPEYREYMKCTGRFLPRLRKSPESYDDARADGGRTMECRVFLLLPEKIELHCALLAVERELPLEIKVDRRQDIIGQLRAAEQTIAALSIRARDAASVDEAVDHLLREFRRILARRQDIQGNRCLVITSEDILSFGAAQGNVAIVSIYDMFWHGACDNWKVTMRCTHELGHTLGLSHCGREACVMHPIPQSVRLCSACRKNIAMYESQKADGGDRRRPSNFNPQYRIIFNVEIRLREALQERIEKVVSWQEKPDAVTSGRSALIQLAKPIWQKKIRAIKIKGLGNFLDPEKPSPPTADEYESWGQPNMSFEFNPAGDFYIRELLPSPAGGVIFSKAQHEYQVHQRAFAQGCPVSVPLAYGEYPGLRYQGETLGFVVLGVSDIEDRRLDQLWLTDEMAVDRDKGICIVRASDYLFESKGSRSIQEFSIDVLSGWGKTMRRFHNAGFIHRAPHGENFSYGKNGIKIHDLGEAKYKKELAPRQIFMYQLFEVSEIMAKIYLWQISPVAVFLSQKNFNMYRHFLEGYFQEEILGRATGINGIIDSVSSALAQMKPAFRQKDFQGPRNYLPLQMMVELYEPMRAVMEKEGIAAPWSKQELAGNIRGCEQRMLELDSWLRKKGVLKFFGFKSGPPRVFGSPDNHTDRENDRRADGGTRQADILIVGASGLVGRDLLAAFSRDHSVAGTYLTHRFPRGYRLDIRERKQVFSVFEALRPAVVIQTAYIASPSYCERHPEEARAINVMGTRNIAEASRDNAALHVFISSESVFGVEENGPNSEEDATSPVNEYGRQKV